MGDCTLHGVSMNCPYRSDMLHYKELQSHKAMKIVASASDIDPMRSDEAPEKDMVKVKVPVYSPL